MSAILTGKSKSPEHSRKISQRMQGWKPSQFMLERARASQKQKWESDPEYRERVMKGLNETRNDPEVKRRRAHGNRKRLKSVWTEFERWLDTDPTKRDPPTQVKFQLQYDVSEATLTKWKQEILHATSSTTT
jgi:hypothetical protein